MRHSTLRAYIHYIAIALFIQTSALGQIHVDTGFIKTKGTWISPIDNIVKIDTMGIGLTIETDSNRIVRSIEYGQVAMVTFIGDDYAVLVRNNDYFIAYSGLKAIPSKRGDYIKAGQELGILAGNNDRSYKLELSLIYCDKTVRNIQDWFTEDFRKKARLLK